MEESVPSMRTNDQPTNPSSDDEVSDATIPAASSAADKMYKIIGESIGKRAAAKSCGLFRADDWQCGKCRNVNWARRSLCNVCNAPKFVEVELRTGVGGGYNEREEKVEYVRRRRAVEGDDNGDDEDDDGEYDEFGRRKRKRSRRKEYDGYYETSGVEEDAVEDESEDEGVDLSKYDLSDWENKEKTENEKNES